MLINFLAPPITLGWRRVRLLSSRQLQRPISRRGSAEEYHAFRSRSCPAVLTFHACQITEPSPTPPGNPRERLARSLGLVIYWTSPGTGFLSLPSLRFRWIKRITRFSKD